MNPEHYSMIIQWDSKDDIYIITVPELPGCKAHGSVHGEAIKNVLEAIKLWLEMAKDLGWPVPQPRTIVV